MFNDCNITTKLISLLGKQGIIIHFYDYYENYVGTFFPKEQLYSGYLIVKQSLLYSDTEKRVKIAKAIVNGIAINIHQTLYHYYRHDTPELKEYLDFLKITVPKLLKNSNTINQILAIEGNIWLRFYDTFKLFLNDDFIINKRVRRPPDNPLNSLISFGNSILYNKTISQIYNTHLNQTISFLHQPSESRFSLSLDLSEVFKPIIVFKTIFDCVNNRKIKVEKHFVSELNYCLLNEEGKKIFISEFDERLNSTFKHPLLNRNVSYKQSIKLDGYKLIKTIIEDKEFVPFDENKKQ